MLMLEPFQLVRALSSVFRNKGSLSPAHVSFAIAIPGINNGFRDIWNTGMAGGRAPLWLPFGASGMSVHACGTLWLVSLLWVYSPKWLWVRKRTPFKNHRLLQDSPPVTQMFLSLQLFSLSRLQQLELKAVILTSRQSSYTWALLFILCMLYDHI